jgi:hypothetical protein
MEKNMTFQIYFTNHGYYSQEKFSNAFDALKYAKEKRFNARICSEDENVVATYSPLYGENWQGLSSLSQITSFYAAQLLGVTIENLQFDVSKPIRLIDVRRHWLMHKYNNIPRKNRRRKNNE